MTRALPALAALAVLSACSGPPPAGNHLCGSALAKCTVPEDCCTGFDCLSGTCSFVGGNGGNNGSGGATSSGSSSTSGGSTAGHGATSSGSGSASSTGACLFGCASTSGGFGSSSGAGSGSSSGGFGGSGSSGGSGGRGTTGGGSTGGGSTGSSGASSGAGGASSGGSSGGVADLCRSCQGDASCNPGESCVFEQVASYCAPPCTAGCPTNTTCTSESDVSTFTQVNVCYPTWGTCNCGAAPPSCQPWSGSPEAAGCLDMGCNPDGGNAEVCQQNGQCVPSCTGQAASDCPAGTFCDQLGHCETNPPDAGGTTGGSGGGTTGGSSGGSTGGGCTETSIDATEFASCPSSTCGAALRCVTDPFLPAGSGTYCEYPCTSTSNCPDPATICYNGTCTAPTCSAPDQACSFQSMQGSCLSSGSVGPDTCLAGGTLAVGGTCNPNGVRCNGSGVACVPGAICETPAAGGTAACRQLCTPIGSSCAGGQSCTDIGDGINGYCP